MDTSMRFSVSMCVYGGDDAEHFSEALKSIVYQSVTPSEVVLVVDGPVSNEINAVIQAYEGKSYFKLIRLAQNAGHGNARRIGLEHCTYDLVALMDADDISAKDRFEKQLAYFHRDPAISIVGGNIQEFIKEPSCAVGLRLVPPDDKEIKAYMRKRCPFNQVTVMFKKPDVLLVGGYIDWNYEEDYYLWLRMYQAGMKFANIPDTLVYVRVGKDMYQRRGGIRYFRSEAKLQRYMLDHHIISFPDYLSNLTKRFIVQLMLPNSLRGYVYTRYARKAA